MSEINFGGYRQEAGKILGALTQIDGWKASISRTGSMKAEFLGQDIRFQGNWDNDSNREDDLARQFVTEVNEALEPVLKKYRKHLVTLLAKTVDDMEFRLDKDGGDHANEKSK